MGPPVGRQVGGFRGVSQIQNSFAEHWGFFLRGARSFVFEGFGRGASVRGGVEKIVGGIRGAVFRAAMSVIAAGGRRLAALGVNSLDGGYVCENAGAGMIRGYEQKPRDGAGVGRVLACDDFADDFAAVVVLPGWTSIVFADGGAVGIEESCVGRFENPSELLVGTCLTDIDLRARCVGLQDDFLRGGGRELRRNLRAWRVLRNRKQKRKKKHKRRSAHSEIEFSMPGQISFARRFTGTPNRSEMNGR